MRSKLNATLAAGLALLASSALAQEYIGVVKRTSGQVVIERDGDRLAPSRGTELQRGDRLVTGPDGYTQVALRTAASLTVGPDSDVPLDRYVPQQPQRFVPSLVQRLTSFLALNRQR